MAQIEREIGDSERFEEVLALLARMAAGEVELRLPVGTRGDYLDALAQGTNILAQELSYCMALLREEKEAATRANRAKSALVAEVSHDIRTPLMAISSFAELLSRENLPADMRSDYSKRMKANCQALNQLVNEVLDIAKVEAGGLNLRVVETCVREKAEEAIGALDPLAKQKGLSLQLSVAASVPETVVLDPLRLWQVINNLVGNAIKFSKEGAIAIRLSVENGETLVVDVVDVGIGVYPEMQSRLFEPFVQGGGSSAGRFGGSGLGLTLARDLCRAMGGDLTLVKSEPGKGSHFRASLKAGRALNHSQPVDV